MGASRDAPRSASTSLGQGLVTAIRWGSYAILVTPLVVVPTVSPVAVGKVVPFRLLVEALFLMWIALLLVEPARRPRITMLSVSVLAYVTVMVIATIFSLDPFHSFWSDGERMDGLFTLLHYAAFFFITAATFRREPETWKRCLRLSVVVGLVCAAVAAVERVRGAPALVGPLGNPAFLAAYLLFNVAFAAYLAVEAPGPRSRWLWALAAAVEGAVALLTGIRGLLVGLVAAALFLLLFVLIRPPVRAARVYALGALILLAASGAALYALRGSALVQETRVLARAASLFNVRAERTARTRLILWRGAVRALGDHPVLGWGPEMTYAAFYQHADAAIMAIERAHFDRLHNKLLEVGIDAGIVGILTYLMIFVALGRTIWTMAVPAAPVRRLGVRLIFSCLGIAYFVQNLFLFDALSSLVMFFLTLALLESLRAPDDDTPRARQERITLPALGAVALAMVAVPTLYAVAANVGHFRTARLLEEAENAGSLPRTLAVLDRLGATRSPFTMEIALLISTATAVAEQRGERLDVGTIRNATDMGIARFGMALAKEPNDVRGYLHLARMLVRGAAVTGEPRYLALADEILRIGVQRVPRFSPLHYWRGVIALARGRHEQAMRHGEDAVRLSPTLAPGWTLLETVYRLSGDEAKAELARARAAALSRESWNP